jgi:hypothetical protein
LSLQSVCLRFERGDVGADDLQPIIEQAVRQGLRTGFGDSGTSGATSGPIDLTENLGAAVDLRDDLVVVAESAQGADPLATQILVSFVAGLSTEVVIGLWKEYVVPALADAFGHRPLGRHIADVSSDAVGRGELPAGRHSRDR